jgi:hypothetical protein
LAEQAFDFMNLGRNVHELMQLSFNIP